MPRDLRKVFWVVWILALYCFQAESRSTIKKPKIFAPSVDDPTAILAFGEQTLRGKSTQATLRMTITRPEYTRVLELRAWTMGRELALIEILSPAKEEGIASLRNRDQMWNYLPKTDGVVRIPNSMMLQSWMGSDLTNDDLVKSSSLVRDYHHRIIRRENVGSDPTVLIECTPQPNAKVVWGKVLYWARQSDFLPVREAYYDEDKKLIRTLSFSEFKKMDDRVVPTRISVTTVGEAESNTLVRYTRILFDRAVDKGIFRKDRLRLTSQKGKVLHAGWSLSRLLR